MPNERFRGTSEIPILPQGIERAHQLGMDLAKKGGLDRIMTSNLQRTQMTSKIISKYTHAPITYVGDSLHPWHLGALEGQEVTPDKIEFMNHLIRQDPDVKVPGRGPQSTADGESFNDFKNRTLNFIKTILQQSQSRPDEKTALVTHGRVKTLLDAWLRKGADPSNDIDNEVMTEPPKSPGSIDKIVVDPYAGPQWQSVDLHSHTPLQGGVYIIRHEKTAWNAPDQKEVANS